MRHLPRWFGSALLIAGLMVPSQAVHAQRAGQFNVSPRLGLVFWDNAAALQDPVLSSGDCDYPQFNHECAKITNNVMAGISALYGVTEQLSVGVAFDVARPVSNGAYFPAMEVEIAGRQQLTLVSQRLTILQFGFEGQYAPSVARISPFLIGSVGGYLVYKDAAKADHAGTTGFERFGDLMFSLGGGLDLELGAASRLRVELRDMVYTGWDRDELYPVLEEYQTDLFPDLLPAPPDASGTLHNFRLAIGFIFVPGGGR